MSQFNFEGWNLKDFVKGREKLLVAVIGYVVTFVSTSNPLYSGIVAAGAEVLYALIKYYVSN